MPCFTSVRFSARTLLLLSTFFVFSEQVFAQPPANFKWLLEFRDKDTHRLLQDKRYLDLMTRIIPGWVEDLAAR